MAQIKLPIRQLKRTTSIDNFNKPTAVANYITKDNYADFSFV